MTWSLSTGAVTLSTTDERFQHYWRTERGSDRLGAESRNAARNLMATDPRVTHIGILTEIDIEIAGAQAGSIDGDLDLPPLRLRPGSLFKPQRERRVKNRGFHGLCQAALRTAPPPAGISIHSPGFNTIDRGMVICFPASAFRCSSNSATSGSRGLQ
jgi:hypothetical protein